jgi:hypothetical protein
MNERLVRSEGFCERGLPLPPEAALLIAAAEAGVTDIAIDVLRRWGLLGTLEAACARGVAVGLLFIGTPLGCSYNGEGGRDDKLMTVGQYKIYKCYSMSMARGIVDCEQQGRPGLSRLHQGCLLQAGWVKRWVI